MAERGVPRPVKVGLLVALGCSVVAAIVLALGVSLIWSMGQAGRDAERVKRALRPGMPLAEVEGLLSGLQVVKSYEVGSGAEARASSADKFAADLAAQARSGSPAAGCLRLTFYAGGPTRVSYSVEFGADAKVIKAGETRSWD